MSHSKTNNRPFKAAWWLPGGHLQTIWPTYQKRAMLFTLSRERLLLPDGDFIDLDWVNDNSDGPIVLLLHGLEGSIQSNYIKGMLNALKNTGFRAALMNFRGCSGEHNRSEKAYHAGETGDLTYVINTLHARYPSTKLMVVGFSLGGNVLLKYLGERQMETPLCCCVAVSVPFLLNRLADKMQKGFSCVYQKKLVSLLRKKMADKNRFIPSLIALDNLDKIDSFWEFDQAITAKLYGFKNAKEYYDQSSSAHYLRNIKKPTLILHAINDPFLYPDAIPLTDSLPQNVQLELSKSGGHVGFVGGSLPWRAEYWLEKRIPDYLKNFV